MCSTIFSEARVSENSELEHIRSRLTEGAAKQFNFEMLKLPTVKDARKRDMGLYEGFLDAVSNNSLGGELERIIPLIGPDASKFVRVYRVVVFKQPLQEFDLSYNYKHGNASYAWEGDFVTPNLSWTWVYAGGFGKDILAEYLVPAGLLEIDTSMRRQEPYYTISKKKMNDAGIENVGVFLNRLAQVDRFRFEDLSWEYDPRFGDNGPPLTGQPPKNIEDKRIRWVDRKTLNEVIKKGE